MSSIKTTQIDGDVSVGRNVAMGGKMEVAGNLTVGHTLLVKGWLDAPNIKGANKGVFITLDELEEAYPEPHAGWYAGVGTSSPFDLYVGRDGGWSSTGGTMTIDTDLTIFENILGEVLSNRSLSGFVVKQSINDLPSVPDIPSLGYLVAGHLYVFVGTGGDTLDGLYQDCGEIRGSQGPIGPKGNDGVVLEGVSLADSIAAVEEAATPSETVPTANATKAVIAAVEANTEEIASAKRDIYGGVIADTADGKQAGVYAATGTSFLRRNDSTGAWVQNSHSGTKFYRINTGPGTDIVRITGGAKFNATPGSYTTFCLLSFRKSTPWTADEWPSEGDWVGLWPGGDNAETRFDSQQKVSGTDYYYIAPASMVVGKSSAIRTFDVVPPAAAQSVFIVGYGAADITITLHKETPVAGHEARIAALEAGAEVIDRMAEVIDGGERTETVDGTALVSPSNYFLDGSFVLHQHNSYSRWIFTNKGYSSITARVGLNAAYANGMCAVAFYDGTAWSVPDSSFILYTAVGMRTFEAEIPAGVTKICVCHRKTTGTASIALTREWEVDPIETRVETLEEKVETISGDGKDMMTRHETRDQDSLMLRNHIKTTWPYFFAAAGTGYDNQPYLDRKIAQIPRGKHFVFVTDTHWGTGSNNGNPSKNSTYIASYVSKRLGGCPVIFGGDCINSEDSEYNAAMRLSQYADEFFAAFGDNGLWVQGNHDSNKLGTGLTSDAEVYRRTVARLAHKVTFDEWSLQHLYTDVHDMTDEQLPEAEGWLRLHYHWDDEDRKVRYIVYETGCCGPTVTQFVTGGSYQLPALFRWLARTLKSTPEGYDIIIAGHMFGTSHSDYLSGVSDGNNLMKMLCAFRMGTSVSINMRLSHLIASDFRDMMYGTSDSFSANFSDTAFTGRLVIVSGHWHNDRAYIKSTAGSTPYPVEYTDAAVTDASVLHVNVNTDHLARNPYYPDRADSALGTVGEVSFDVITLTADDKVVCTRIGYYDGTVCPFFNEQGERVFRLTPLDPDDDTDIDAGQAE